MYLVQLLLPLHDNSGAAFPHEFFLNVRDALVQRFGGVTAHSRAPAAGLWQDTPDARPVHDDIVVYEVMVETLDRAWWATYRRELESRFAQEELVVRAEHIELL